jgi:hypothetical protein
LELLGLELIYVNQGLKSQPRLVFESQRTDLFIFGLVEDIGPVLPAGVSLIDQFHPSCLVNAKVG